MKKLLYRNMKARPTLSLHSIFTFIFIICLPNIPSVTSDKDPFLYGGCTQQKYTPGSPYESNLNSLLTSLVNSATYLPYNNYTIMGSSTQDVVYGMYQCRGDLSMPDCASCVARSVSRVGALCHLTCGGTVQLEGCYIKYDNSSFLGVEDKTIVLKKCGPSIGYDSDGMTRRDAVLAALTSSGGAFRIGGSVNVQGMAQCVGDLSFVECQDCISYAIGRLKSDCGTANYGDMFLAQCYARYSTNGAQFYSKPHNGKPSNEGEKTFAIIIGLLAGVALLIIFLLFITKVFGGNGK